MFRLTSGGQRKFAFITVPLLTVALLVSLSAIQKLIVGYPLNPKGFIVPLVFGVLVGIVIAALLRRLFAHTERLEETAAALELSEARLRQEKERYRTVADFTHNWEMWLAPDGRPLYISPACERITGYSAEEMMAEPQLHLKIICPDCVEDLMQLLMLTKQDVCELEFVIRRRDGGLRWIAHTCRKVTGPDGEFKGWRSSNRDITDRKHLDAELQRFALVIGQARESVVITDTDGNITYVNPAFERLTGYGLEEVTGQNPRILKSGRQDPAVYQELWATILAGDTWTGQLVNKKQDGSLFTEETTISPLRSPTGEVINYVAVKNDITQELQLKEQLLQSQKMEAIGRLAGGVAHDFNNLLSVIQGYTELTLRSSTNRIAAQNLQEILAATERATTLIRQLLAFSRKQVLRKTNLLLGDVVTDMTKMIRRIIGEDITLETSNDPGQGQIHADRGQIEQIVMNLCVNARDAMPRGGKLIIATGSKEFDAEFCQAYSWAQPGCYVILSVADTGCGMDEETQQRIFEPFFTTKNVGEGTGLGLSTVFGIINQHDGVVHVYSEVGNGTVFKLYFPVSQATETEPAAISAQPPSNGTETLLLADDDASLRRMIKLMLESAGYSVITAVDGQEALERYTECRGEIALVLFDVVMPRTGGPEAYRRIQAVDGGVPVLFLSGYPAGNFREGFAESQTVQLLEKPFSRADLLRRVRGLLDARNGG